MSEWLEENILEDWLTKWAYAIAAGLISREDAEKEIIEGKECPFAPAQHRSSVSYEHLKGTRWKHRATGELMTVTHFDVKHKRSQKKMLRFISSAVMLNEDGSETETNEVML